MNFVIFAMFNLSILDIKMHKNYEIRRIYKL